MRKSALLGGSTAAQQRAFTIYSPPSPRGGRGRRSIDRREIDRGGWGFFISPA
jgi:hypothetical protein